MNAFSSTVVHKETPVSVDQAHRIVRNQMLNNEHLCSTIPTEVLALLQRFTDDTQKSTAKEAEEQTNT